MVERDYFDLTNKVALITGGAGLLGREHACAILEKRGRVVLVDKEPAALDCAIESFSKAYRDRILPIVLDITSEQDVSQSLKDLSEKKIRIDILINNAAINPAVKKGSQKEDFSRLENYQVDQWNFELSVGLTGAFICSKHFGNRMASDGQGGVILNIASDLSAIAPDQRIYSVDGRAPKDQPVKPVTYSVIKTGLIGLTRYLATYWADRGVRSNALSPGGVYVDQPDEFRSKLENLIPLGRMAEVSEYKATVQFLCSDASAYLNGQNIIVDGGRSVW